MTKHAPDDSAPLLSLEKISKRFPGVRALDQVELQVRTGEVHAIVGENGAGKSTLMNLIAGVYQPDEGTLRLSGRPIVIANPVHARRLGIVTVFQEADLFGPLSVAENMALGQGLPTGPLGWVRWGEVYRQAEKSIAALAEAIDVRQPAENLSIGQRHMTQVAAAVAHAARIVILDEPTSALSASESEWLFVQIQAMRSRGSAILYISHRQDEIFRLADRITVLRDGRKVWTGETSATDREKLVVAMVGRETAVVERAHATPESRPPASAPRLRVSGYTAADGSFRDIDLTCAAGEVLGVYGLIGAGRSELAQSLFGLRPILRGTLEIDGKKVESASAQEAVAAGLAYVPEDRLRQGVCRGLSVRTNATLSSLQRWSSGLLVNRSTEKQACTELVADFDVRLRSIEQPIGQLSGGNQQKVVLARWLLTEPRVLILDEPTRGVDVAAKAEIHRLIRRLADQGCAILLISSELPEVLAYSDRIAVFRAGNLVAEVATAEATAEAIAQVALPPDAAPHVLVAESGGVKPAKDRPSRLKARRTAQGRTEIGLAVAIGALCVALSVTTNGQFLTVDSLLSVLESGSVRTILALGAAAVIIAGGIDISIGSLLALSAAAGGMVMTSLGDSAFAIPCGVLIGLAVGVSGGLLNAGCALLGGIHPIVVTLGTLTIFRGIMITLTGGNVIAGLPREFASLATGHVAGVSGSVILLVLAVLLANLWFARVRTGRHLYAIGSSETAARLCGIERTRVWLLAFGVGGLTAAMAGLLELALNGSMQSVLGTGYELKAIAAAVIGGTAITGGRGTAVGVALGALLLTLVEKSLVLWSVSQYRNDLVIGGLLTAAILIDRALHRGGR
jgi:ABC-type sugar transport system ATPase subunit/ribose/xylose/arabinose/galactoside ABC-type transport system permease subunit